jgi:RNA binding exosome subunit
MVKQIHQIAVTAFYRVDETRFSVEELQNSLYWFIPEDIEEKNFAKEKISLEQESIKIEDGVDLEKFVVTIAKDKHNNKMLQEFKNVLGEEQCALLLEQDDRLDSRFDLFIRIDKEKWIKEEVAELTQSGDCLHIKLTIAAYPKNKESAWEVVQQIFGK